MMKPIRYNQFDCSSLADQLTGIAVISHRLDISDSTPHAEYGGVERFNYTYSATGETVYVLERKTLYAPDSNDYSVECWKFAENFDTADAALFLDHIDRARQSAGRRPRNDNGIER